MSSVSNPTPKRGGLHPLYGAFVGGGPMDADYNLINPDMHCVSQLRTIKQLQNIQTSLEQARDNISGIKFHGNLEVDELKSTTELDKKNFVEKVELLVNSHGFQHFFYMQGADGKMHSLLTHSHLFTLTDVVKEHRSRAAPHVPIVDDTGVETQESKTAGHSKYDAFEKLDCNLSHLAVQSIIGKVLQDDIKTRYSHYDDFLFLPGSVYFMMALEASNASVALDIDDAIEKFASLSLSSYPGENVKGFATEALRLIKIMEGGYCLPLRLGSDLLKKVYSTSCEHFNRWIHARLDEVRELELTYKLKDPKLMMDDPRYSTLGPIALCGFLQEKYGSLVTEKAWPALSSSYPSSNLAPIVNTEVRKCFFCNSTEHLRDTCPKLGRDNNRRGKRTNGKHSPPPTPQPTPTPTSSSETTTTPAIRGAFPAWRYIEPVDKTSVVVVGEHSYKWCSKCRCRATGKQGYFTTHHFTHEHVDKKVSLGNGPEANHSSIVPLVPLADDAIVDTDIPEDEQLVFAGPWHCSVFVDSPEDVSTDNYVAWCDDGEILQDHGFSIWFTPIDEDYELAGNSVHSDVASVSSNDDAVVPLVVVEGVIQADVLSPAPRMDVPHAVPVLSNPPDASALLLFDSDYSHSYRTVPPISVIDLDYVTYHPCDNVECDFVGPGGFNCNQCSLGVFNTALVQCLSCHNGCGFLGDSCDVCELPLWGTHVLPLPIPSQSLNDYVEEDSECASIIPRNSARLHHVFDGTQFVPYPAANWSCVPSGSSSMYCSGISKEVDDDSEWFLDACEEDDSSLDLSWCDHDGVHAVDPVDSSFVDPHDSFLLSWISRCNGFVLFMFTCFLHVCGLFGGWVRSSWNGICFSSCFWLFVGGTLFWDALELYRRGLPASVPPRRLRRQPQLARYPPHWMILSCLMLLGGRRIFSPGSYLLHPFSATLSRCSRISSFVHMSPVVVMDLHRARWGSLCSLMKEEMCPSLDLIKRSVIVGSEGPHSLEEPIGLEEPISLEEPSSSEETLATLEESPNDLLFYDAAESLDSFDFLQLDDLFPCGPIIDCSTHDDLCVSPSKPGLNAALSGVNFLDCLAPSSLDKFPVIFDSGASIAITGNRNDFVGALTPPARDLRLGGMARGAKVVGIGVVHWKFPTKEGSITLALTCYFVPECRARLPSPQRLLNSSDKIDGVFTIKKEHATLLINNYPELIIEYDSHSHLPIGLGCNAMPFTLQPQMNLCITADENQNLTPSQKLLLMWHFRFGHRNMPHVQHLLRLPIFTGEKYKAASRAEIPKCAICEYAKAHAKPTSGNSQSTNPITDGALKDGALRPGSRVSADHFESRLKGRTYTSFGKTTSDQFVGGCIFVDHMSGYIHVEHQLGFSSSETIRAKQNFEQLALGHGVLIEEYLADNGVFSKTKFMEHIRQHNQQVHYCGVNAHHKNAVAERAIRTVSELARSLLLHASVHWPAGVDGTLWPMAVDYATHLYNTLPNQHGMCPADLFTGTSVPRHKLRDLHVWGCPVYVLDPTLQQGMKLPRWQPRSRRGLFLGYSPHHSSDVPLVLNLQTGSISPQFHVVFDDSFSTVASISQDDTPPSFWNAPNLESCIYRVPVDAKDPTVSLLPDDWLTPPELEEKRHHMARQSRIRESYLPLQDITPSSNSGTCSLSHPIDGAAEQASDRVPVASSDGDPTPTVISSPIVSDGVSPTVPSPVASSSDTDPSSPVMPSSPMEPTESVRRSTRATRGTFQSTKFIDEVYLSSILEVPRSHNEVELAYHAALHTDLDTGYVNYYDAHAYVAQLKKHDPDNPSYAEAMSGDDAQHYIEAMQMEVRALLLQRTWTRVDRDMVPPNSDGSDRKILKGTWAFKLKRLPDGTPLKYKARYCCRGDMQTEGVDYFDTYAPVVQWSTIRLVLTLALKHGWSTRQVDYTNAFAQAHLQEEVYIEPPRGFAGKDGKDKVLKLLKSLYGLKQAPKTFFEKLRAGLLERGFTQSNIDPCLFLKENMLCVVYVDDTILCGPNSDDLEKEIQGLGVNTLEQRHCFQLRNEGEVGDFLGIRIQKQGNGTFLLTQTGLIDKVLTTAGLTDCNPISTPTSKEALGSNRDGEPFNERWKYATVIGMLLYLSGNTRPDITFAVHQCARYSHCPKQSHAVAVKRILRYLKGTKDKGMIFTPGDAFEVNCFVDADFAGLWGAEYDQDPVSVKSRTGYIIMFMGCPLLWVSKLQTQIALSTMEAEYIALSSAMRELIAIREVLKEIKQIVFKTSSNPSYAMIAKTFEPLPTSKIFEDNDSCLKFATLPRMSPRTKHIAIPYHFFRTKITELEITVLPIDTNDQLADQFTKGLREDDFVRGRKRVMGW